MAVKDHTCCLAQQQQARCRAAGRRTVPGGMAAAVRSAPQGPASGRRGHTPGCWWWRRMASQPARCSGPGCTREPRHRAPLHAPGRALAAAQTWTPAAAPTSSARDSEAAAGYFVVLRATLARHKAHHCLYEISTFSMHHWVLPAAVATAVGLPPLLLPTAGRVIMIILLSLPHCPKGITQPRLLAYTFLPPLAPLACAPARSIRSGRPPPSHSLMQPALGDKGWRGLGIHPERSAACRTSSPPAQCAHPTHTLGASRAQKARGALVGLLLTRRVDWDCPPGGWPPVLGAQA